MKATEVLSNEHRVIEQVLNCLEQIAQHAAAAGDVDWRAAEQAIDFFRNFADRCHHEKEEAQLFPMLEAKGFSRQFGPTGVMLWEHEQGRDQIRAMRAAIQDSKNGSQPAREQFVQHARAYVRLLRDHINKEDHCLFPMADQALSPDDQETLMRSFGQIEQAEIAEGQHDKYLALADDLAARLGVTRSERDTAVGSCSHFGHGT